MTDKEKKEKIAYQEYLDRISAPLVLKPVSKERLEQLKKEGKI